MTTEATGATNLPIPPGEYLEEVIEDLGMSKGELATRMGRPPAKLSAIFNGDKAVTPDTALQLERVTGVPAHIWTGLETEYRLAQARQRAEEREAECLQETELVPRFCYRELAGLGMVPKATRRIDKVKALQDYFGVMSLHSVLQMPRYQVAFRHGRGKGAARSPEAVAAWLRVGEVRAHEADCLPFNAKHLEGALSDLRALTRQAPSTFQPALHKYLTEAGVVLVFCPHFPKTKAHGAVFFVTSEKAVMMLSVRYKWADIFWFTLFHELGHILLHGQKSVIIEDARKDPKEQEADAFARDTLIPSGDWKGFTETQRFDSAAIRAFARQVTIDPGVVVGRLQHERYLGQSVANGLRTRYEFKKTE